MSSPFRLDGKRVAVMGGSSGIGLGIARLAHEQGAAVTIASRTRARLDAARRTLGEVETASVDLLDPDVVRVFFAEHDPFDHVAVTAADLTTGSLRGTDLEAAHSAMSSKFWTAVHVAREARIVPTGSLTLVSGILSRRPSREATILTAINTALEALSQALALELSPVRVNCITPGRIDTPWWDRLLPAERKELLDRTAARLPVKRIGTPCDIALQAVALMANSFMTGAVVPVDGGGSIS